jgi:DNA-binding transcriptional MerR regulator
MTAVNKITKYHLEARVRELNEKGVSLRDIADILTKESDTVINKNSVYNFIKSDVKTTAELIEKKDTLKVKVVEAEISTIAQRQQVIEGLLGLAQYAENEHTRVLAFKEANNALDSLDKRLGKLTGGSSLTINNINAVKLSEVPTEQLLRMINATDR